LGTVYLVGAGPGDPGLLTLRAAKLLRRADVVIHDALVSPEILAMASPGAEMIDVGKRCGGRSTRQVEIHRELIRSARRNRVVVRLKGGDPFVFGRGGEEALALREAGIPFRVVPGITAGVGAAAYAGIPVTHRGLASAVTFVTGHEDPTSSASGVDWDALGRVGGTIVIYMGVARLPALLERLVAAGRAADTPAAIVECGSCREQRTVKGTLADVAELAAVAGVGAPALAIVGEVVSLHDQLAWFEPRSLRGARVLVGRSRPQPSRLARALAGMGARVTEFPRPRAVPPLDAAALRRAVAGVSPGGWLLFTSSTAVERFWEEVLALGLDARALAGVRFACFGTVTAAALKRVGITADVATPTFEVDAVVARLSERTTLPGTRITFFREQAEPSAITRRLRALGAAVEEVFAYRIEEDLGESDSLLEELRRGEIDAIVLSSSSVARRVAATLGPAVANARVIAIGPRTAQAALACGLPVHALPDDSTLPGLVRGIFELVGPRSGPFAFRALSAKRAPA
jgi:uroporphyrinogen III methyltransferase / synthase